MPGDKGKQGSWQAGLLFLQVVPPCLSNLMVYIIATKINILQNSQITFLPYFSLSLFLILCGCWNRWDVGLIAEYCEYDWLLYAYFLHIFLPCLPLNKIIFCLFPKNFYSLFFLFFGLSVALPIPDTSGVIPAYQDFHAPSFLQLVCAESNYVMQNALHESVI